MPERHLVVQGECIASIAHARGFVWQTVWDDAANAALRDLRGDPFCLLPGDEVVVPDRQAKSVGATTGKRHRFRLHSTPIKFRLRLVVDGEPLANLPYQLLADGVPIEGTTDADGRIEQFVPPLVEELALVLDGQRYELRARHLDPAATISGAQMRLRNLGKYDGAVDGVMNPATAAALSEVQRDARLEVTGKLTPETAAALDAAHAAADHWQG